jgi:hypothetical protein
MDPNLAIFLIMAVAMTAAVTLIIATTWDTRPGPACRGSRSRPEQMRARSALLSLENEDR